MNQTYHILSLIQHVTTSIHSHPLSSCFISCKNIRNAHSRWTLIKRVGCLLDRFHSTTWNIYTHALSSNHQLHPWHLYYRKEKLARKTFKCNETSFSKRLWFPSSHMDVTRRLSFTTQISIKWKKSQWHPHCETWSRMPRQRNLSHQ